MMVASWKRTRNEPGSSTNVCVLDDQVNGWKDYCFGFGMDENDESERVKTNEETTLAVNTALEPRRSVDFRRVSVNGEQRSQALSSPTWRTSGKKENYNCVNVLSSTGLSDESRYDGGVTLMNLKPNRYPRTKLI